MYVCDTLQVHLYNMFGTQLPRHFSMGSEVQREGILDCQLYGDGLVVLTKGCSCGQYLVWQSPALRSWPALP